MCELDKVPTKNKGFSKKLENYCGIFIAFFF